VEPVEDRLLPSFSLSGPTSFGAPMEHRAGPGLHDDPGVQLFQPAPDPGGAPVEFGHPGPMPSFGARGGFDWWHHLDSVRTAEREDITESVPGSEPGRLVSWPAASESGPQVLAAVEVRAIPTTAAPVAGSPTAATVAPPTAATGSPQPGVPATPSPAGSLVGTVAPVESPTPQAPAVPSGGAVYGAAPASGVVAVETPEGKTTELPPAASPGTPAPPAADPPAVEAGVLLGVPVAGLIPFDTTAVEKAAGEFLDRLSDLGAEWQDGMTDPERYAWLTAAALVASGAAYAVRARRTGPGRDRVTLGTDSVLERWEERHAGETP
jgi:hypothetical protein